LRRRKDDAERLDLALRMEPGALIRITSDQLVEDVMRRWPQTIRVFLDHKFLCVGCPIANLHTVVDACGSHAAELTPFLALLNEAADAAHAKGSAARKRVRRRKRARASRRS
jgi:hybrid cluster-associated redox disulfide protein